jgi:SAM-dependent methyltransferase
VIALDVRIPPSFDSAFYRKDKPFLKSDSEAYEHFLSTGKEQGLKGSPCCDQGYLLNFVRNLGPDLMLEIGPGCSPKLKGPNVRYFDVKSKAELDARYRNEPNGVNVPDEIHYVDQSGYLKGIQEKFDVVFSSHAIEHTMDLISHLNEVERVLNTNGMYVVVVPNKKYTFDHFKPVTVLEDVLAKHFDPAKAPSFLLRAILFEANRRAHNSPERHWQNDHGEFTFNKANIQNSIARFQSTSSDSVSASGYHNWIFTEENFAEIINHLHEMGLTSLKVQACYNTPFGGMSFSAILTKN